jgi:hypothetical protein
MDIAACYIDLDLFRQRNQQSSTCCECIRKIWLHGSVACKRIGNGEITEPDFGPEIGGKSMLDEAIVYNC